MRMSLLVALGALLWIGTAPVQAAPKASDIPAIDSTATVETLADGTEILIAHEPELALHWSPSRGFHYGRNCCKKGGGGSARVSSQRFAGIDAAAGRPMYVRNARF